MTHIYKVSDMLNSYSLVVHMPEWDVLLDLAYPSCPVCLTWKSAVQVVLKQVTLGCQLVISVRKTVTKYPLKGLIQNKVIIAT